MTTNEDRNREAVEQLYTALSRKYREAGQEPPGKWLALRVGMEVWAMADQVELDGYEFSRTAKTIVATVFAGLVEAGVTPTAEKVAKQFVDRAMGRKKPPSIPEA